MRDMFGAPVDIGDIIISAAGATGRLKVGKVYRFDRNGNPWIVHRSKKYNLDTGEREDCWQKSEAGAGVIVIGYPSGDFPKSIGQAVRDKYPE